MTIKKQTKFKTTDGREFDDEKEAQKHDELILAREQYDASLRRLNRLIAETTRTADGYLFEFGLWTSYHYVTPGYFQMPVLGEVHYIGWNWDLNEHDDSVEIVTRGGNDNRRSEYKISNLYREKSKALAALVKAQQEWLAERQSEVEETAAKVAQGIDPTR